MIDSVQTRDTLDQAITEDEEAVHLRRQLEALRQEAGLARELADVESVAGLRADLGISPTARTFDVWFDDVFSDRTVLSSIKDSLVRVDTAVTSLRGAMQRMDDLQARRDALLGE